MSEPELSPLTRFQKFTMERWNRPDIKNAPYNPRKIDSFARKKLRSFIKSFGLLAPITVNRRTGNIVGGHMRLAATDALEGPKKAGRYSMDVAVVDLTEKEEREANIALNNPLMQGEWDVPLLGKLLGETSPELKIDTAIAGFEPLELQLVFESAGLPAPEAILGEVDEEIEAVVDEVENMAPRADRTAHEASDDEGDPTTDEGDEAPGESGEDETSYDEDGNVIPDAEGTYDERTAHVKRQKEGLKQQSFDRTDTEYMLIVVCKDREDREQLATHLGLGPDGKYIDAAKLWHKMGVDR